MYLLLDTTFVLNFSCLFESIFEIFKMHLKQVSWVFNICHLTFEYKILIVWVLILHVLNYLSKTESSFQTFRRSLSDWFGTRCKCKGSIYLDNSKSATTLQWKLHLTLVFYCKICTFRIILFYIVSYQRMNKPRMHANIIGISSFQNGLNYSFNSTSLYFKSKLVESSHEK